MISRLLAKTRLNRADCAFAIELFYGALRNAKLLDFWIKCLRPTRVEDHLRDVLRLGLYQLFILEVAEHAAVYETVELAQKRCRALVNGILRTSVRRKEELRERASAQPLDVRTSHPKFLIARWEQNFGVEAAKRLCIWNNRPPPLYARINQLKIDAHRFLRTYPKSRLLVHNLDFVELDEFPTQAIERGHCYIQDPSTAIACQLLDPQVNEKILDACAAPGGKTSYIAQRMQNRGVIVACDRELERVHILEENMDRLGVGTARTVCHDWRRSSIPKEITSLAPFDRILIDAPCTNTGVVRRRPDVRWRLRPADFVRMQEQQLKIVSALVGLLKVAGTLIYSTCSLEPEENEELVHRVVASLPLLRLEKTKHSVPIHDHFDGAFVAALMKSGS